MQMKSNLNRCTFNNSLIYFNIILLTIISAYLNFNLSISFFSYNLRSSYLFILAVIILLILSLFRENVIIHVPYWRLFSFFIFIYFISTFLNFSSKYFYRGIADCVLLTFNFFHYFLIVNLLATNKKKLNILFKVFIIAGGILSLIGILLILISLTGLNLPVFDYYVKRDFLHNKDLSTFPRLIFFHTVAGGALSTTSLIGFCYYSISRERNVLYIFISSILSFVGMLLCYARGAILGFLIGFVFFILLMFIRKKNDRIFLNRILILFFVFLLIFSAISIMPVSKEIVFGKIKLLLDVSEGTGAHRISWWKEMVIDFFNRPFLGYGASNYRKFRESASSSITGVSENFYIEVLHSSGLIGFGTLFLINIIVIVRALKKIFNRTKENVYLISFLCGYICISVVAFTNPIAWASFFWVTLAFFVASLKYEELDY